MSERATKLHSTPWQGVFYITGGGTLLISEMLTTAGASATVLEVNVPYATSALTQLLGRAPEQATSETTALKLAMAAFERAQTLGEGALFGFGCTASLATNREKKGAHRAHWAIQTRSDTHVFSASYAADRPAEEAQLLDQMWWSLLEILVDDSAPIPSNLKQTSAHGSAAIQELLKPEFSRLCVGCDDGMLILPGSFNPLHAGHQKMLRIAEGVTGMIGTGAYELSIRNAEKHSLDFLTLERRLANIKERNVWLTNAPMFEDKAHLFPGTTFVLGVDTMSRIGELRFYDNQPEKLQSAIQTFTDLAVSFLVFGRIHGDTFISLADLSLPEALMVLCQGVSEKDFRNDLSSTTLRMRNSP